MYRIDSRRSLIGKTENKTPSKQETSIYLKCGFGCSMFVVDKSVWDDGETNYNITVQDFPYDHNHITL